MNGGRNHISGNTNGPVVQAGQVTGGLTITTAPSTPPAPPVPRELPPPTARFTNRARELARLEKLVEGGARLIIAAGFGGSGKTSAVVEFAHRAAPHYPDGQVFLHLGGSQPAPASEVLGAALRSLGVHGSALPPTEAGRVGMWRTLTHTRRLLIVADDAATAQQVRPLIPAGTGCLLLATSRTRLSGLLPDGAVWVPVDPLGQDGAAELLARLLPEDQVAGRDLDALAGLCAGMPLAVAAVAGLLALDPDCPTDQALEALTGRRAHHISVLSPSEEDSAMYAGLDAAHTALPTEPRRLYALLGALPGPRITAELAAALLSSEEVEARAALRALSEANLLTPAGNGAWEIHDVVRDHAAGILETLPEEAATAHKAVRGHYRYAALRADATLNPRRWRLEDPQGAEPLPDQRTALDWWAAEGAAVDAVIRRAHEAGEHGDVVRLVDSCKSRFAGLRPHAAWEEATDLGVSSARASGDRYAEAVMLLLRAQRHMCFGRFEAAESTGREALALGRGLGDAQVMGSSCEVLAQATTTRDRPAEALPIAEEAIAHHERVGSPRGLAIQWRFYAQILDRLGEHGRAHSYFTEALAVFREQDDAYQAVQTLTRRVPALIALGHLEEAAAGAAEALAAARRTGQQVQIGNALAALADIAAARGHGQEERRLLEEAHQVLAPIGVPEAGRVAARLEHSRP
ncbi:hypothetical protein J0910_30540 [Nocardiopsis sp. CNT-189]|uniref:hypothetical protein n=1 Tax=Nocardiopsis oceanisediminis TaxID=2816862 RepID=UPI003B325704